MKIPKTEHPAIKRKVELKGTSRTAKEYGVTYAAIRNIVKGITKGATEPPQEDELIQWANYYARSEEETLDQLVHRLLRRHRRLVEGNYPACELE